MLKNILAAALMLLSGAGGVKAVTLTADSCVKMALASDEKMREAANNIEKARLQKQIAYTAYLPNFSGMASGLYYPDSKVEEMAMTIQMRGVYLAGINLTQPIYAGGKIVAANKMASIGREAADLQMELTSDQLKAQAETSYWTYVAVLSKIRMMESYKALVDTAYARTLSAVNAGMAVKNDLLRVEARRSQLEYQLGQVMNGADLCRMALCRTVGLDDSTPISPADTEVPTAIPADLGEYDLTARPEVKLLGADIRVKEEQVKMTRADFLPTVGLTAGWSAYGNIRISSMAQAPDGSYVPVKQTINNNGFNVMLSASIPLFHWGEGIKKVKAAKIDVTNARLALEENTRLMNLEVRQAIANVRTGESQLVSAEKAMEVAQASLESVEQTYNVGMSTLTDLLDAQSQWQTSYANLIEARTQLRINVIEYLRVTARI
ncbi:MAG: TolC family protein [Bacteroides sp.]|nr:TolC family protein [Bacteroides sp.]